MGGFASLPLVLADDAHTPDRLEGAALTAGTFDVVTPVLVTGRLFTADDDRPGAPAVALLSDRVWTSRYGASSSVFDQPVLVNGASTRIIGVFATRSRLPLTADVWIPASTPAVAPRSLQAIGRLRDGATVAALREEASAAWRANANGTDVPEARVVPINERYFGRLTDTVWLAFMSVGILVVLISCANVANLLIERSLHRAREIAIRASLGASRRRVVRQLLIESSVLAALGGLGGLVLGVVGVRGFRRLIPANALPYWYDYSLDWRVLAVLIGVSAATVLVFGLIPAIGASKVDVNRVLKAGGIEARMRASRWTTAFLTVELALTVVMLANLAVGLRANDRVPVAEREIDRRDIVTASLSLTGARYATPQQRTAFFRDLDDRIRALPAQPVASLASALPLSGSVQQKVLAARTTFSSADAPAVSTVVIGPRYFETLGLSLLGGRELDGWNVNGAPPEAIVNERFAQLFFDGESPVGQRIVLQALGTAAPITYQIVGQAPSIRQRVRPDPEPVVYTRLDASPLPTVTLIARTGDTDGASLASALRQSLVALDPSIPLYRVNTLAQAMRDSNWNGRVSDALIRLLTLLALALSTAGLYAVTAQAASRRSREIALRLALGARPEHVGGLLLRRVARQVALGFGAGVVCTLLWSRAFASGQPGPGILDPRALAMAGALLAAVAVIATLGPVRRALRVDPVSILRTE
jgi:predicted permease